MERRIVKIIHATAYLLLVNEPARANSSPMELELLTERL